MVSGSGNHLVDQYEENERRQERNSKTLACGCYRRCTCDEYDEEEE